MQRPRGQSGFERARPARQQLVRGRTGHKVAGLQPTGPVQETGEETREGHAATEDAQGATQTTRKPAGHGAKTDRPEAGKRSTPTQERQPGLEHTRPVKPKQAQNATAEAGYANQTGVQGRK